MKISLTEAYNAYDKVDGWSDDDIELHKSINWKDRNYEDYDAGDSYIGVATLYGDGEPQESKVEFHKFIRSNPIFPPYYAPINKPFEHGVGPMFDGNTHGRYDVHDRYETQELYDTLSD